MSAPTFDPTTLDGFTEVDNVCPVTVLVSIGGATHQLRCEEDAGHEPPHSGTLLWANDEQENQR